MNWYIERFVSILTRPVEFFSDLPKGTWQEDPLSFSLATSWIISFALTLLVFINSYLPTGLSLIDGIYGQKLLIAFPVLSVMGFVFFSMTLLIVGGIFAIAITGMFFCFGYLINFIFMLMGGSGALLDVIKASLYCSAAILFSLINILLIFGIKLKVISISAWIMSERLIFFAVSVLLLYLFMVIGEKVHKCSRWKAFLAATVPFVLLVLFNIILSGKILPKIIGILG